MAETKGKIIDRHLKINDINELVEYIQDIIFAKYNPQTYFEVFGIEDDTVEGEYNGAQFLINYVRGKECTLVVEEDIAPNAANTLLKIISPVMWVVDENSVAPRRYCSPIIKYKDNENRTIYLWDNYDPIRTLTNIIYNVKYGLPISEVEILYPEFSIEDIEKNLLYGKYIGFLTYEAEKEINNYTEYELYSSIINVTNELKRISRIKNLDEEDDYKVNNYTHLVCYLMQQTKRFGVKVNKPSKKPTEPTVDLIAWTKWWGKAVEEAAKNEANIFCFSTKHKTEELDKNFRPDGSYKEYIPKEKNQSENLNKPRKSDKEKSSEKGQE